MRRSGWRLYRHTATVYPKWNDQWGVTVRSLTRHGLRRQLRRQSTPAG